MPIVSLPRSLILLQGADAATFLQGLVTNNVSRVTQEGVAFSALLSPQGKYLFDFFLLPHEEGFLIECDRSSADALIKRLSLYKLRADVSITPLESPYAVYAVWEDDTSPACDIVYDDPRLTTLGKRCLIMGPGAPASDGFETYEAHRISLGVVDGARDLEPDKSLLLEYGYDELQAIDFAKGCYVGQEVTARSKHRANLRKFVHIVRATQGKSLPQKGTAITSEGKEIGQMLSSAGEQGLAIMRVEEASQPHTFEADSIAVEASLPPWCQTRFAHQSKD